MTFYILAVLLSIEYSVLDNTLEIDGNMDLSEAIIDFLLVTIGLWPTVAILVGIGALFTIWGALDLKNNPKSPTL